MNIISSINKNKERRSNAGLAAKIKIKARLMSHDLKYLREVYSRYSNEIDVGGLQSQIEVLSRELANTKVLEMQTRQLNQEQ